MDYKKFYTELGKLLYAVAKADGEVQDEELHQIYKMVVNEISDDLLFGREDEVDSYYTEFEFEALMDKNSTMTEALNSFYRFFDEYKDQFTPRMKATTMKAITEVAEAYEGIIPEEQEVIDKIEQLLNE